MLNFSEYINESFTNIIGNNKQKEMVVDEVWSVLQLSYAKIGGLKGAGFGSKQEMIGAIPFWKIGRKSGKIVLVIMYKDKEGRKLVALGTNGSPEGKQLLQNALAAEFKRSYFEVSGPLLKFICSLFSFDFLKQYIKTPKEASDIMKEPVHKPIAAEKENIPSAFVQYVYSRKLGGEIHNKIMFGTSGKVIT